MVDQVTAEPAADHAKPVPGRLRAQRDRAAGSLVRQRPVASRTRGSGRRLLNGRPFLYRRMLMRKGEAEDNRFAWVAEVGHMVQVSGQCCPADNVVTFQGRQVEGKC